MAAKAQQKKALAFDFYKMSDNILDWTMPPPNSDGSGDDLKKRLDSSFKKLYAQYSGTDDSSQSSQPATTPNEDDDDDIMCHYSMSDVCTSCTQGCAVKGSATWQEIVPRFKVKVEISDGGSTCIFVIFDSDMSYILEKSCAHFVGKSKPASPLIDIESDVDSNDVDYVVED
ncbi:hypothetical protein P8452_08173 [Trifolium repens]|nr:hypothetical protein P8452_08173 [Trifolium repens]